MTDSTPISIIGIFDIVGLSHDLNIDALFDIEGLSHPISLTGLTSASHGVTSVFRCDMG